MRAEASGAEEVLSEWSCISVTHYGTLGNASVQRGSGYLGTLVLPVLAQRHHLRIFDVRPSKDLKAEYISGSVCDHPALVNAAAGMDAVLDMAMGSHVPINGCDWGRIESHADAFDVSVKGLYLALHAAHDAGIPHAVYTSSLTVCHENGAGRYLSDEDLPPDSRHIYGFTKRLGDKVCRNACRDWGISVNVLRLSLPISEERWLAAARETEPTPLTTAEDTARALLAALEYRAGFQAFSISGDYKQKLMSLANYFFSGMPSTFLAGSSSNFSCLR